MELVDAFLARKGVTLHYWTRGQAAAPLVVLTHGTTVDHYEPGYTIDKPLLLMVGDDDSTGNIRKAMPRWAEREPDCRLVVIPNAKHAANLDNPDFFHRTVMDFLTPFVGR